MSAVQSVDWKHPTQFVQRFGYLLVPAESLQRLFDTLVRWKAEASPLGLKLESGEPKTRQTQEQEGELRAALQLYTRLPEVHQSADGRLVGLLVAPKKGLTSLGEISELLVELERVSGEIGRRHGVSAGVAGTLRNKVDVFNLVRRDLGTSGTFAAIGILLVLALSFRSVLILPVLLYPLGVGLLGAFALIPTLVGELNTITSFLVMILLGMGVEFSIHLVKRFQGELAHKGLEASLHETFRSTGRSILTSCLTTALGMAILVLSSFRGFSEYGVISGSSMVTIFVAVMTVLPAALVAGYRLGLVRAHAAEERSRSLLLPQWATALLAVAVLASAVLAVRSLSFDYDFTELQTEAPDAALVKQRQRQVYPGSLTPGALYVAPDLERLDATLRALQASKAEQGDRGTLGRLSSLREPIPDAREASARRELLAALQDGLQGRWVRRVKDPEQKHWIEATRDFAAPADDPKLEDLPPELARLYHSRDGSGALLLAVYPNGERKNGRLAMAFAEQLRRLPLPDGVQGPTGETLIFAEILSLVTTEGPWLVVLTFLGIVLLVLWDSGWSLPQTGWILLPLAAGIVLTLGGMVVFGWKLNFFNMIVLPNLIGMSVDSGVHYYRRWLELGLDTRATQRELFAPLTGSTLTTMVGYAGMLLAHHQGLRSIGCLAVLGLACCWATSMFLLPGLLRQLERRAAARRSPQSEPWYEPMLGEPQVSG